MLARDYTAESLSSKIPIMWEFEVTFWREPVPPLTSGNVKYVPISIFYFNGNVVLRAKKT